MKKILVVVTLLLATLLQTHAQYDRSNRLGFGVGPGVFYGDNAGIYQEFKFLVLPVTTVDYSMSLHPFFDIKATVGWQMINSGDFISEARKELFSQAGLPYGFKGNMFFGDVMPVFHFNPDQSGYLPSLYKVYTGVGLGFFHAVRTDERFTYNEMGRETRSYPATGAHFYIPFRLGVFKSINNDSGEIGLEGTMLFSPFGEIDGNDWHMRAINTDIVSQLQFYYRIPLGKY